MPKESQTDREVAKELQTSGSGFDVLRYVCLPDLLGKESSSILYIMGKNLARKLRPASIEETIEYFRLFGWGKLQVAKEKRREIIFELTGQAVEQRFKTMEEVEYRLEAGFLAESLGQINNDDFECFPEVKPKKSNVQFNAVYSN